MSVIDEKSPRLRNVDEWQVTVLGVRLFAQPIRGARQQLFFFSTNSLGHIDFNDLLLEQLLL